MNILALKKLLNLLDADALKSTADHIAIGKIKDYLKELNDEDEIEAAYLFQIVQFISFDDQSTLFAVIKKELGHHFLFDLCDILYANDCLEEPIFKYAYNNMAAFESNEADSRRVEFKRTLVNLANAKLLNEHSFKAAFARITEKSPPVEVLTIQKESRKDTKEARTHIKSIDGKYNFFMGADKQSVKGGFSVVKKGYDTMTTNEASYGIKKITGSVRRENDDGHRDAAREVKCNRLLMRDADYYATPDSSISRSHFYRVITPWQEGKDLRKYTPLELKQATYEDKFQCLSQALEELNTLHQHNRIHGDLKPANFILNLNAKTLKIIDFGGSIKFGSGKKPAHTRFYGDPHKDAAHFYSDVYSMAGIAKILFPELYFYVNQYSKTFLPGEFATFTLVKKDHLSVIEKAIIQLIDAMQHPDTSLRCTSADAAGYCKKILENLSELDENMLREITESTIARTNTTVEDILREARINQYSFK
ncbi:protein kinase [Legionella anisa]|uniref:Protein kinase domain-containing protein n=2 Tax=Legionella anisa TaxID=28082 RepID=A0AAX0WR95_9GAMM|nr:protein kinase [Legionella anisa]AWN75104.1 hypothetical protein DLD14_15350 [Legionella anisa]KTC68465.1 Protein kinase domain protein [Legionella anisa]MBN5934443.1 protein kinase [Legionella anisa]MCW8424688.1 protein kinase [Legionella anisa]MCW8446193.1 protein kinase [Legionella anisa]